LALFYFAGHGVQIKGENYLIPVDFSDKTAETVPRHAVLASEVRKELESRGAALRIVILDACRNNPFPIRGIGGGLAKVEVDEVGTLVGFSAAPNAVAPDGPEGGNSPYTSVLVSELQVPQRRIDDTFREVQEKVFNASKMGQNPHYESGIRRPYILMPNPLPAPRPEPTMVPVPGGPYVIPGVGKVLLDAFEIGRAKITRGEYRQWMCLAAPGGGGEDSPMTGVSWDEAVQFCDRVNKSALTRKYRLPREEEWLVAASGGRNGSINAVADVPQQNDTRRFELEHPTLPGILDGAEWCGDTWKAVRSDEKTEMKGWRLFRAPGRREAALSSFRREDLGFRVVAQPRP
jgi:hypothetical protein